MNYFVTAIGTDSGKTLVSAILVEALQADYWKPIQAGFPRDTDAVSQLITNTKTTFHQEAYLLNTPASPHAAAKIDDVVVKAENIFPPKTENHLVIEGAGGVLVPINDEETILDLVTNLNAEIILVSNLYLGSINHTLLTAEVIKSRGYTVKGIIFNGTPNEESQRIILKKTGFRQLLHVLPEAEINKETVLKYAQKISL